MSKIIVTGALGFVGANIAEALATKHEILIVDDLNSPKKTINLNRLNKLKLVGRFEFINQLEKYKEFDVIIHAGACSDTTNYDQKYMIENNFEYSKTLIDFSITNNMNFIFSSSASVYGLGLNGFNVDLKCEDPLNIYAKSKLMVDNYIRKILNKQVNIQSKILSLRYFNIYGYSEFHKQNMASVPFHFFNQLNSSKTINLFDGSEDFYRDFIHVSDIVSITKFFLKNPNSGIFNAGTGECRSFVDIAKITKKRFKNIEIKYIPFPNKLKSKYQNYTKANIDSLRDIGYTKDFKTLELGLNEYYDQLEKIKK
jgi:ADP-L-glycero-D-manno-heptose 6-epimerase